MKLPYRGLGVNWRIIKAKDRYEHHYQAQHPNYNAQEQAYSY
jgi:hypothetical protein